MSESSAVTISFTRKSALEQDTVQRQRGHKMIRLPTFLCLIVGIATGCDAGQDGTGSADIPSQGLQQATAEILSTVLADLTQQRPAGFNVDFRLAKADTVAGIYSPTTTAFARQPSSPLLAEVAARFAKVRIINADSVRRPAFYSISVPLITGSRARVFTSWTENEPEHSSIFTEYILERGGDGSWRIVDKRNAGGEG